MTKIFHLRIALKCMAVELATPVVLMDTVKSVRQAYRQMKVDFQKRDTTSLQATDILVHDLEREHCGNRRLQLSLASQMDLFRRAQNTIVVQMPASYKIALPEDLKIIDAVCDRDVERAVVAMRAHLERSRARLEEHIDAAAFSPAMPQSTNR